MSSLSDMQREICLKFGASFLFSDEHLRVVVTQVPAIPPDLRARGYDHVGDIDVVAGVVYAPLEQPHYELGQQVKPANPLKPDDRLRGQGSWI